ncbi:hypothetical protein PG984_008098 [Apiospora sp. TS-2023a]
MAARKVKQWFKQGFQPPAVGIRGKRKVRSSDPLADMGEDVALRRDDEAFVIGNSKDFLKAENWCKVYLPIYGMKRNGPSAMITHPQPPMTFVDVLRQICDDLRLARLLLFDSARRRTSLLTTAATGWIKLSGAALELDKTLCEAFQELECEIHKGEAGTRYYHILHEIAKNQQIKDTLATTNKSLRRVEKTLRDRIVKTFKTGMIHRKKKIDYDEIREQIELSRKEALEACSNLQGVAEDVSGVRVTNHENSGVSAVQRRQPLPLSSIG